MTRLPYKTVCHPTFWAQTLCAVVAQMCRELQTSACGWCCALMSFCWLDTLSNLTPQLLSCAVIWVASRSCYFVHAPLFSFMAAIKEKESLVSGKLRCCSQSLFGGSPASPINSSPYLTQVPPNNSNILLSILFWPLTNVPFYVQSLLQCF